MPRKRSYLRITIVFFLLFYLLPVGSVVGVRHFTQNSNSWWEMRRDSSLQAPDAKTTQEAVVQVYAARAARWKGSFGVHTWIASKKSSDNFYTRVEVIGYGTQRGRNAVRIRPGTPDSYWFDNKPELLREIRGGRKVDDIIERIYKSAQAYPFNTSYTIWPGPNSNTFMAYLGRSVPELRLELPTNAIGKDYLPYPNFIAHTPSGLGVQVNFAGYAGVLLGLESGIELNLLGLSAGIDVYPFALKLPAIGRIGLSDFKHKKIPDTIAIKETQTSGGGHAILVK